MYLDTQNRPQGEQVDAVAPAKLRLSEAIRIGAKLRPKCIASPFWNDHSCAIGAAFEASFGTISYDDRLVYKLIERRFPELLRMSGKKNMQLKAQIWGLNDSGHSRESIADWLQSQGL